MGNGILRKDILRGNTLGDVPHKLRGKLHNPVRGRFPAGNLGHCLRLRLEAQLAFQLEGEQQPQTRKNPEHADVFFRGFAQQQPQKQHRQNHHRPMKAGGEYILK